MNLKNIIAAVCLLISSSALAGEILEKNEIIYLPAGSETIKGKQIKMIEELSKECEDSGENKIADVLDSNFDHLHQDNQLYGYDISAKIYCK